MTVKLPQIGKLSITGKRTADLEDVVTAIAVNYSTGSMAELTITLADQKNKLTVSPLAAIGALIGFDGERWQVGAIDTDLGEWGASITMRCRDPLARKLRKTYKTSAEKKVSPGDWVKGRTKLAGGTAVVQPSSKRGTIAQSKNQSALDVIGDLAGQLEWSWTSYADRLIFGSRYYAWQGSLAGLSTWQVTWMSNPATDALSATIADSDDDTENRATLDLDLPYAYGAKMRPWHRLVSTIPGAVGTWLIEDVTITHDGVTPVTISATQPKKPSPKAGSSAKES